MKGNFKGISNLNIFVGAYPAKKQKGLHFTEIIMG